MKKAFTAFTAFTLIELIVVIAIIALVAALVIPAISQIHKSKSESTEQTVLEKGAEQYIINVDPNIEAQQKHNVKKLFEIDGTTFYSFEYSFYGSTKIVIFANAPSYNNNCMITM